MELTDALLTRSAKVRDHATATVGAKERTGVRSSIPATEMNTSTIRVLGNARLILSAEVTDTAPMENVMDPVDVHQKSSVTLTNLRMKIMKLRMTSVRGNASLTSSAKV